MSLPTGKARRRWIRWARYLMITGTLTAGVAWLLIVFYDVESVMGTGPILFSLGLGTMTCAGKSRYTGALLTGASQFGICVLFVALVNLLDWSPHEAEQPFAWMGAAYLLATVPAAWIVARRAPQAFDPGECPRCGYLLFGLQTPRCPECGEPFHPGLLENLAPPVERRETWN